MDHPDGLVYQGPAGIGGRTVKGLICTVGIIGREIPVAFMVIDGNLTFDK